MIPLLLLLLAFLPSPALWAGEPLLLRQGDGGRDDPFFLRKVEEELAATGCVGQVRSVEAEAPVPADTILEFSPEAHTVTAGRLPGFVLLARARPLGGGKNVEGALVVRAFSGFTRLEGLKNEGIAFVTPHSVPGYLAPLALLEQAGVSPSPEKSFFARGHDHAIGLLLHDEVAAAAVAAPLAREWGGRNGLRILAVTSGLSVGGWWLRRDMAGMTEACARGVTTLSAMAMRAFPRWIEGFDRVEGDR